jgi:hypothetical protein
MAMFGACEDGHVSSDHYRLARKDDVEIEWGAMHLPARQAIAHAHSIRLATRLDSYLAASAAAFMDGVCICDGLGGYTSRD